MSFVHNRSFVVRVSILLFVIVFSCFLSLCAEEVEKKHIFVNELTDKGKIVYEDFKKAVANKDFENAAKSYQTLISEFGEAVSKTEGGRFILLRTITEPQFLSLGDNAIAQFREQFDPQALQLQKDYESGDFSAATKLVRAFPFSSHTPRALAFLASIYADSGRFGFCRTSIERILQIFPDFVEQNKMLLALYSISLSKQNDSEGLVLLRSLIEKNNWSEVSVEGKSILDFIDTLIKKKPDLQSDSEWKFPCGNHSTVALTSLYLSGRLP